MKAINIFKLAIVALAIGLTSCEKLGLEIEGSGPIVEETFSFSSFDEIESLISGDIYITQGGVQSVVISGQQNIIDHLKTDVSNNKWKIDFERGNYDYKELSIYITVPEINMVKMNGSGAAEIEDFVQSSDLALKIPGSGDITLNKFDGGNNLTVSISGSGNVICQDTYSGLNDLDIVISGSGTFEGFQAITKSCDIDIPGSGSCEVNALDYLNVDISGSGTVKYMGSPKIDFNSNAAGKVIQE